MKLSWKNPGNSLKIHTKLELSIFLKISIPKSIILPRIILSWKILILTLKITWEMDMKKCRNPDHTNLGIKEVNFSTTFISSISLRTFGASWLQFGIDTTQPSQSCMTYSCEMTLEGPSSVCDKLEPISSKNNVILEINAVKIYIACSSSYSFTLL